MLSAELPLLGKAARRKSHLNGVLTGQKEWEVRGGSPAGKGAWQERSLALPSAGRSSSELRRAVVRPGPQDPLS